MKRLLKRIFKLYSEQELLLSFEYGLVISESAKEMKVEITPDISRKAEIMIVGEFSSKSSQELADQMIPNILSVFEIDITK